MKTRFSLSTKILLLAFLNFSLLLVNFSLFAKAEFRVDLGSFVLAPVRDRILSVSRLIALDLPEHTPDSWTTLLNQYSAAYPSQFYLFTSDGNQMSGAQVTLPPAIDAWVKDDHNPFFEGRGHHGARNRVNESASRPPEPLTLLKSGDPQLYWAAIHIPIRNPSLNHPLHGSLVWAFPSLWTNSFFFNYKPYLACIGAVILVSIACWLPLIRGLTRSIYRLTQATGLIAEGQFDIQLPHKRRDELGQLSDSIQRMAERLSGYVHGQKRFLGDIAHELCSPIARIQMALGILEQRAPESQQEYVADLQEEVQHMSALVNELLSFSKAEITTGQQTLESVNVAATLERVLLREASEDVRITHNIAPHVEVKASPDYLFRALANLVRNAVRYAGDAGPITISAKQDGRFIRIVVADAGPGLPENEIEEVFKPFYRPELARQRDTGGVGLGLAIVRSCVEACGGAVQCRNRTPTGLEVEIRLYSSDARLAAVVEEPLELEAKRHL